MSLDAAWAWQAEPPPRGINEWNFPRKKEVWDSNMKYYDILVVILVLIWLCSIFHFGGKCTS